MTFLNVFGVATSITAIALAFHPAGAIAVDHEKRARVSLIENPATYVAGEYVVITPDKPMPVYGVTTNLCFAIGDPFKKEGSDFVGKNLRVKKTLDHIFNADKNSGSYDLDQILLNGEYKTETGRVLPIPGNISLSRQRVDEGADLFQIHVCGNIAPHYPDPVVSIRFTVSKTFEADGVSWVTSDSLRHRRVNSQKEIDPKLIKETKEALRLTDEQATYSKGQALKLDLRQPLRVSRGMPNVCFAIGEAYYEGSTFEESVRSLHTAVEESAPNVTMQHDYTTGPGVIRGHITNLKGTNFPLDTSLHAFTGRVEPLEFGARQAFLCARAHDANKTQDITAINIQFLQNVTIKYVTWYHPFAFQ